MPTQLKLTPSESVEIRSSTLIRALDPYESDIGRLRSDEELPQRIRPRRLIETGDG